MSKKILRKGDKLLLTINIIEDLLSEIGNPFGLFSIPYEQIYGFTGAYKGKLGVREAVGRLIRGGFLNKETREKEKYIKISRSGRDKIKKILPIYSYKDNKWDGKWRILIFDVPEVRKSLREGLRRKIYTYGFRRLQKSVYISPFPIEKDLVAFLETLGLTANVIFFLSEAIFGGGDKVLAEEVWDLSAINNKYKEILDKAKGMLDKELVGKLQGEYVEVLTEDPFLPKELLPVGWLRERVIVEIRKNLLL